MATKDLIRRGETIPSIFNDFFRPWGSLFNDTNGGSLFNNLNPLNVPAVNIAEKKEQFDVSLAAPGMKKEDFNIDVEGNVLTISAETKEEKEQKDERYTRKEFNYSSFSRSFTLPDGVNKDKIDASYENGLLKVTLPKTEDAKKAASKHISVK
ncbi:MAG TPA: Hsp20/alpha crystallin family protein [Puia sp.]|jgi:HSP20 family protein|uniref:Hsp20/alpha crystallin family protein n=1 Tax=Puia sp. TaxID=2045100 RepID=UPI002BA53ED9|nr:Hsp20/alpha crystallin family protein [Puia sp.]HVU94184.1 Hsp20/alpha crystallin family protein [Puia sp.]